MTGPEALPMLDMSRLDQGAEPAAAFGGELRDVMHEVGFFYLTGHGISPALIDELFEVSRRFFALPLQDRLSIENVHSPQFRGYTRVGGELTNGQVDWREQIDVLAERDVVPHGPGVPDYWRLEGPNLWPAALPEMRRIVERWMSELTSVSMRLMRSLAVALGQPQDVFDPAFAQRPTIFVKVIRYPGDSQPQRQQGVGAHRDGGVLTLLMVEPGKGGLQIEHDGDWIEAPAVPGAFVVNIGEMLELATDGYLKATLHRVQSPRAGSDRISVPYFFNPAFDARMPTLPLPADLQGKARGLSMDPLDNPILETYGDNVLRYRLRAHPDVAAIHHPDLVAAAGFPATEEGGS
jgi:isopenicillin N synthase-like dioxygenase